MLRFIDQKNSSKNHFFSDGKNVDCIEEFNENEQLTQKTFFQIDGKTRNFTEIYDMHSHKIKTIFLEQTGKDKTELWNIIDRNN
ncbi:MAG: DUF2963 domain-containing protein ['Conium maculatum' witches'-broom phytoplasma]|nr:DUF2963 domain-containing protein ['Conium maculatum' witches'-broom phytoplasma]